MFGHIQANAADLTKEDKARYRGVYCGLCHTLNGSITSLYETPMENCYFAAASHIKTFLRKINGISLY